MHDHHIYKDALHILWTIRGSTVKVKLYKVDIVTKVNPLNSQNYKFHAVLPILNTIQPTYIKNEVYSYHLLVYVDSVNVIKTLRKNVTLRMVFTHFKKQTNTYC